MKRACRLAAVNTMCNLGYKAHQFTRPQGPHLFTGSANSPTFSTRVGGFNEVMPHKVLGAALAGGGLKKIACALCGGCT